MRKPTSTNYQNQLALVTDCPLISTFHLLGGRWKVHLLYAMRNESVRFSEFKRQMMGISDKMLAQQLRELEQTGFVERHTLEHTIPVGVEYRLTPLGQSFVPVMEQIYAWARGNDMVSRYKHLLDASVSVS